MVGAEFNFDLILKQNEGLERLMMSNPDMVKDVQGIISRALKQARDETSAGFTTKHGDPRNAASAVRMSMYKSLLGGQINILNSRKAHGTTSYERPRKLDDNPGQRGGNRRKRSEKTVRMDSYSGLDRGMILRWIEGGVGERMTKYGNRGGFGGNGWFSSASRRAMAHAIETISGEIEMLLSEQGLT